MTTTASAPAKPLLTKQRQLERLYREYREHPDFEHLRYRNRMVEGQGSPKPPVVFVGPVPAKLDAQTGQPYSGPEGHVINTMLSVIDLKREHVYITFLLKYRAPNDRDPRNDEVFASLPFLQRELALLKPKIIVPLGRVVSNIFAPGVNIVHHHGEVIPAKKRTVIPMWPPSAALVNQQIRDSLYSDILKVGELL